ncbi:MAG: A/G-specific adenine glycosylase [Limnohabitans sp.]|nr:A/G-specific adenine glycosylase [Limnohabitans sp.]
MSKELKSRSAIVKNFATLLVKWQRQYGRHDLPWQVSLDPYSVWLSEIMLQQTQVATVKEYFFRFMQKFPTLKDLARASNDEVMSLWSGLGYYSRAKNLHACAQRIAKDYKGEFPKTVLELQELPGIGPSTAAAITSLCFGSREAILDGNVKRVLTRVLTFSGDMTSATHVKNLFQMAQQLLPDKKSDMPAYTQGLMDLGATVCTPKKTSCANCPMSKICISHRHQTVENFPVRTKKIKRSAQSISLLMFRNAKNQIYLEKRSANGIWANLYCLPAFESDQALLNDVPAQSRKEPFFHAPFLHVLTHKDLYLHVVEIKNAKPLLKQTGQWLTPKEWQLMGLPAPIRLLLLNESKH